MTGWAKGGHQKERFVSGFRFERELCSSKDKM